MFFKVVVFMKKSTKNNTDSQKKVEVIARERIQYFMLATKFGC